MNDRMSATDLTVALGKEFYRHQQELYDYCKEQFGPSRNVLLRNNESCSWSWDCAFGTQFFEFVNPEDKEKFENHIKETYL